MDQKLFNTLNSQSEKSDYLKYYFKQAGYDYSNEEKESFVTEIDDDYILDSSISSEAFDRDEIKDSPSLNDHNQKDGSKTA